MSLPTVFVLSRGKTAGRKSALFFHMCDSAEVATILARSTRDLFGYQTWVADYQAPADADTIARHAAWDQRIAAHESLSTGPGL